MAWRNRQIVAAVRLRQGPATQVRRIDQGVERTMAGHHLDVGPLDSLRPLVGTVTMSVKGRRNKGVYYANFGLRQLLHQKSRGAFSSERSTHMRQVWLASA